MLDTSIYLTEEKKEESRIKVLATLSVVHNKSEIQRDSQMGMTFLGLTRHGDCIYFATTPEIVKEHKLTKSMMLRKMNILLRKEELTVKGFLKTPDGFAVIDEKIYNRNVKQSSRRYLLVEYEGIKYITDVARLNKHTKHYAKGRETTQGLHFGNYVNLMRRGRFYAN